MKVVVTFSECDQSRDDVITGRVAIVKWLVAKPVSERVDAESCLLDEENPEDSAVDEAAEPVAPAETAGKHGKEEAHEHDHLEIVAVLPNDDWVFVEVGYVGTADTLWVLLHQHPSEVGVEETFADRVWVLVGVGVAVVGSVISRPPPH